MSKKPKILILEDGPYMVFGGVPLIREEIVADEEGVPFEWRIVERFQVGEEYSLCRCGMSKSKPFCDGSHEDKFYGREVARRASYLELAEKLEGATIDLTDAKSLCAGARFCHRAGGIWKLVEESDDPEKRKIAIEEAFNCPSGRLVVWEKNGKPIEPKLEPVISVTEDTSARVSGPLWVKGGISVESHDGYRYEVRNRVTLCRCGRSMNKPFCDGSHMMGFNDGYFER